MLSPPPFVEGPQRPPSHRFLRQHAIHHSFLFHLSYSIATARVGLASLL